MEDKHTRLRRKRAESISDCLLGTLSHIYPSLFMSSCFLSRGEADLLLVLMLTKFSFAAL